MSGTSSTVGWAPLSTPDTSEAVLEAEGSSSTKVGSCSPVPPQAAKVRASAAAAAKARIFLNIGYPSQKSLDKRKAGSCKTRCSLVTRTRIELVLPP